MPVSPATHASARNAVHALGAITGVLISLAAGWIIARDYESTVQNAELHLDSYAVVIAENTRLALLTAPPEVIAEMKGVSEPNPGATAVHEFFAQLYSRLNLTYTGRITLIRRDGTLVTTVPRRDELAGRKYAEHSLFSGGLKPRETGSLEAPGLVDTDRRLIAYRDLTGYPVLVVVSTPMAQVLAEWRRDGLAIAFGALLLAAMSGAASLFLGRQLRLTDQLTENIVNNEKRLNSIMASTMDAIITVDQNQEIIVFNNAAGEIFQCSAKEALGGRLERFIPERFREAHAEHVTRFGSEGKTMRRMGRGMVLAGRRTDGQEFPIDASISHTTVEGHELYTVILRDISERERANEALNRSNRELRELYESMHQVREAERMRIARELHDELAQWLTALKMDATWIATRLPQEHEQLVGKAERMKAVVDDTVAAVRRIAADLRPVMLDDLGLVSAVESLLNDLSERTGVDVRLDGTGDELALHDPLATAVYRMIQEALTNIARHAQAKTVIVEIRAADQRLSVRVRDDGRGLKPDPNRKSFGVLGIRERARTLGGDARIYSPPEGGTVVEIDIPLGAQRVSGAAA